MHLEMRTISMLCSLLIATASYLPETLAPFVVQMNATQNISTTNGNQGNWTKIIKFPTSEKWSCSADRTGPRFVRPDRDEGAGFVRHAMKGKCANFRAEISGEAENHVFCSGGTAYKRSTKGLTSFGRSQGWKSDTIETFGSSDNSVFSAEIQYVCDGTSAFLFSANNTFHYRVHSLFVCPDTPTDFPISDLLVDKFKCIEHSDSLWRYVACQDRGEWNVTQSKSDEAFVLGVGNLSDMSFVNDGVRLQSFRSELISPSRPKWLPAPTHVQVTLRGGETCAATGAERIVRLWFECSLESNATPRIETVFEPTVCEYVVVIRTSEVCIWKNLRWKKRAVADYQTVTCDSVID